MKGGGSSCCVQSCQNSVGRRNKNVIFYSFPIGNSEQRQQWIKSIGRKNPDGSYWEPSPHSVICSEHFVGGKKSASPDSEGFLPTLFPPPRQTPPPIHRPPIIRNPVRSAPQKRSNWIETIDDEDVDDPEYNFQKDNSTNRSPMNMNNMNNGAANRGRKRTHHDYNDEDGATESDLVVAKMSLINSLISELTCTQCGDKSLSIKKSREDKRIVYGLKLHCRKCKVLKEVLSSTKVKVNLTAAERNLLERGRSNSQATFHRCAQCSKTFNDAIALRAHQRTHTDELKSAPTPTPTPTPTPAPSQQSSSYFDMGVEEEQHEVNVETQGQNSVILPRSSTSKSSISSTASTSKSTPKAPKVKQEKGNLKEEPIDIVEESIDDPLEMEGSSASHDSYFMDSVVTEEPNET